MPYNELQKHRLQIKKAMGALLIQSLTTAQNNHYNSMRSTVMEALKWTSLDKIAKALGTDRTTLRNRYQIPKNYMKTKAQTNVGSIS